MIPSKRGGVLKRFAMMWFVVALTTPNFAGASSQVRFEDYFVEGALRVDIIHAGKVDEDVISVRRVIKEPFWSGPRNKLIPEFDHGKYRLDVIDSASGNVIYRYGFGTLFGEWITTDEAKNTRRAFEETLEMPYPKAPVIIKVHLRDSKGAMDEIFSVNVDPAFHQIGRSPKLPALAEAEVIELQVVGDHSEKVDILVLGDGYLVTEKEKFRGDLDRFMENFFESDPFKSRWEDFNIRAVYLPSNTSGVDEPRKGIHSDTPFGMMFNMFDLPRYCMTEDVWAIHDAAAQVPHDAILLMANSSRYGGGAIYNHYTVFVSDNEYDDYLTVHEFGHGFVGLGDEYYSSSVAYNEFYPAGVEPWEPNITALLDPANVKWKRFVDEGTPLPTPEEDDAWRDKVGAFEGAGYAAKNLFRPAKDCKMFSKGNKNFCAVCEDAAIRMINHYADRQEHPVQ
jgi:hypothetical protein